MPPQEARIIFSCMLRQVFKRNFTKAAPEPLLPSAAELWESRNLKQDKRLPEDDAFFDHKLFTPNSTPLTGFKYPLKEPLHFPKIDQSRNSVQKTGVDSIAK